MKLWSHLRGEILKAKRTPALLLTVLAPYVVSLVFVVLLLSEGERFLGRGSVSAWGWLAESSLVAWTTVVFPVVAALVAAQVAAVEHRARGFQLLFLLPVPRLQSYLAKQAVVLLLLGLSHLLLASGMVATGWLLRWARPGLGFEAPLPWTSMLLGPALVFAASWLYLALLTWVALLRKDFVLPVALGFVAMVSLLVVRGLAPEWAPFHPASYAAESVRAIARQSLAPAWAWLGFGGGTIFAGFAGWSFAQRDVH